MNIRRRELMAVLAISLTLAAVGIALLASGASLVSAYTDLEIRTQLGRGYYDPSVYSTLEGAKNVLRGKNLLLIGAGLTGMSAIPIATYLTCKWIRSLIKK